MGGTSQKWLIWFEQQKIITEKSSVMSLFKNALNTGHRMIREIFKDLYIFQFRS